MCVSTSPGGGSPGSACESPRPQDDGDGDDDDDDGDDDDDDDDNDDDYVEYYDDITSMAMIMTKI